MAADLAVFSTDLAQVVETGDVAALLETHVDLTMVGGEVVHQTESLEVSA
jgi:predicted amidohydrolase YtcJ